MNVPVDSNGHGLPLLLLLLNLIENDVKDFSVLGSHLFDCFGHGPLFVFEMSRDVDRGACTRVH